MAMVQIWLLENLIGRVLVCDFKAFNGVSGLRLTPTSIGIQGIEDHFEWRAHFKGTWHRL